ncbi:STAS domain-containing protein [Rhodococcoides yunnanense]|uniref:STAS domain-containing protein n=1 Tax=Rhodococcoides yunnanense TaxID=278209 RepID=UPI000934D7E8|nr:STAS domain-containing protein [Rhodococcus yunnanensis]
MSSNDEITRLDVTVHTVGTTAVVSARGEVDMLTVPRLGAGIEQALASTQTALIVDLSDVTFLASIGMAALVTAHRTAGETVTTLVVADGPHTRRPMQLVGLDSILTIYPDLATALATLTQIPTTDEPLDPVA